MLGGSRPRLKLRRSTLRRLTALPKHKLRVGVEEDEANGPAAGGRSSPTRDDDDAFNPVPRDPTERRKHFLRTSNLKRVFRHLDLSEDGVLDANEVYEAQKGIGGTLGKDEVAEILWEVDDERDGKLDWKQFVTAYYRSQRDEGGFQPKRFYSIVEFLLMDRDCSGEIELDEAMATLFERVGKNDLEAVTRRFFKAAGVIDSDKEPPPGTTVSFMNYYHRVGCERPVVPSKTNLIRSWSHRVRLDEGKPLPPPLPINKSASTGLLPSMLEAKRDAEREVMRAASRRPPPPILTQRSGSRSGPAPLRLTHSLRTPARQPSSPLLGLFNRPATTA